MTTAFIYNGFPYESHQEFLCATFDNGSEVITIPHQIGGIFLSHMDSSVIAGNTGISIASLAKTSDLTETTHQVGEVVKGVWRPGLKLNLDTALAINKEELARSKRDIRLLIQKLDSILLYVEPSNISLKVYSHKLRELLILSCTEVESFWIHYMKEAGESTDRLTTKDYVRLLHPLFLNEYEITFNRYPFTYSTKPFGQWDVSNPTTTLSWYDAYNKAKHDKILNFDQATLEDCLNSISALIVLFCIKYGPYEITAGHDLFANLISEHFVINIIDPDRKSFYIPMLKKFTKINGALSSTWISAPDGWDWNVLPFSI